MPVTHAKVSAIPDGADTSVVRPSDWNADHVGSPVTIEEVDGSPSVEATKLVLPNGTLGVVGTVATYTPAASTAASWVQDVTETGTSFANFTSFAGGTWGSNGTEITQTDTSATHGRVKYNTLVPIGFPTIVEVEARIVSVGSLGRAGILISDGSNAAGLAGLIVYIQENDDTINVERDGIALEDSTSATIATGTWYKIRIALGSSWVSVYLDGTLKLNAMLSSAFNAKNKFVGLYSYGASDLFRNFKVWTLTGAAPA